MCKVQYLVYNGGRGGIGVYIVQIVSSKEEDKSAETYIFSLCWSDRSTVHGSRAPNARPYDPIYAEV